MLYLKHASGTAREVVNRLTAACAAHNFGVLSVIDLKEKMRAKGVDFQPDCLILEVCNPHQAKTVLNVDLSISTVLPCRISVYRDKDTLHVATLRPTALINFFNQPSLLPVAHQVEQSLLAIIDSACP